MAGFALVCELFGTLGGIAYHRSDVEQGDALADFCRKQLEHRVAMVDKGMRNLAPHHAPRRLAR